MAVPLKIDLACGKKKVVGCLGFDRVHLPGVDVVCDLDRGIPLADNCVDEAFCCWFYEHCQDVVKLTEEIHRVLKPGGRLVIKVPYYTHFQAFNDPTNKHFFAYDTFTYFTEDNDYNFYTQARFKIVQRFLGCNSGFYPLRRLINSLANHWPRFYEEYLNKFLRANCMRIELRKTGVEGKAKRLT